jgi:hypothetical protein
MLDIIGKTLYGNQNKVSEYRVARYDDNANGDSSVNAVGTDDNTGGDLISLMTGRYYEMNNNVLMTMLTMLGSIFTPTNLNKIPKLELRVFYATKYSGGAWSTPNSNMVSIANSIKQWMVSPVSASANGKTVLPTAPSSIGLHVDPKNIKIITVDMDDKSTDKIPSKAAHNFAKTLYTDNAMYANEEAALFEGVVDIWVSFSDPADTVETQPTGKTVNDQSLQQKMEQLQKDIDTRVNQIQQMNNANVDTSGSQGNSSGNNSQVA